MNKDFKNLILQSLYVEAENKDSYAMKAFKLKRADYYHIIEQGVFSETGENYYIFIYRYFSGGANKYGAVLFIYRRFNANKPLLTKYYDDGLDTTQRNLYANSAVFSLKYNCKNTMKIGGKTQKLYDGLKKLIIDYSGKETNKEKQIKAIAFNPEERSVEVREVKLKPNTKTNTSTHNPSFTEALKKLKSVTHTNERESEEQAAATLGLALVMEDQYYRTARFRTVFVPIKENGTYGVAKKVTPSTLARYSRDLTDTSPGKLLEEYHTHLLHYTQNSEGGPQAIEIVNRLYFPKLVELLFQLPQELSQCHSYAPDKNHHPLLRKRFKKLKVSFAPRRDRENLDISLELLDSKGNSLCASKNYDLIIHDHKNNYLVLVLPGKKICLAVPEEPGSFDKFFRFLAGVDKMPAAHLETVCQALKHVESANLEVLPKPLPLFRLKFRPVPIIKILEAETQPGMPKKGQGPTHGRIQLKFDYKTETDKFLKKKNNKAVVTCARDKEFEKYCLELLKKDQRLEQQQNEEQQNSRKELKEEIIFEIHKGKEQNWLIENGADYKQKGFNIYKEKEGKYIADTCSTIRMQMKHGIKWLDFIPALRNSKGKTISIESIDTANRTVVDKNGELHLLKKADIERVEKLHLYAEPNGDGYRIPSGNHVLIRELFHPGMESIPPIKEKLRAAGKLSSAPGNKTAGDIQLTRSFNGQLREYQQAGFDWLCFLHENNLSGCLADDMGLGKTVQTLAFLSTLKDRGELKTSLLVVPVSALPNWEAEIGKFAPGLTYYRYMGVKRNSDDGEWQKHDLLITSYATLRIDIELLRKFTFDYIVLDESQNIKNFTSRVSKAAKSLAGGHRLALSGTPLENNSMEMWSLFDFLMPGYLGTTNWFKQHWAIPVERDGDVEKAKLLKKMVYPFMLRRKKEEVEKELPAKTEIVERLRMEEEQLHIYAETARLYRD
ncbi:MAG: DEAD/DEAH box helicase family protein, partial [bacterium]|nr:DEAD/DEAH box helicase family protein [bacterium]